jgi:hypothetical protein
MCTAGDLAVTAGAMVSGLTHVGLPIELRNVAAVACRIRGYPRVLAVNAAGHVVATARQTPSGYLGGLFNAGSHTPPLVTLDPGKRASAFVEGYDYSLATGGAKGCAPYPALLVTPPNSTRSVRVLLPSPRSLCSGLQVHPVVPGTSGRSETLT